jgi:hypothetical protein
LIQRLEDLRKGKGKVILDTNDRKADRRDRHSRWLTSFLSNGFCLLTYLTGLL